MKLNEIINILTPSREPLRITAERRESAPLGYSIDSRTLRAGELFFAIKGEVHDGHRFVPDALSKGAVAAVVSRDFLAGKGEINRTSSQASESEALIAVEDTLEALQLLASRVLRAWRGREAAITGSMGKTTTKDLAACALASAGRILKTTGNLNNAYGLPLSVLKMESDGASARDFDFAVLEMGMNHKGEIAALTRIAPPDLGVVTNVSAAHLEFFDSVDEIAEAKSEMVMGVKAGGAVVLNADDARVARMRELRSDLETRTFGILETADVSARNISSDDLAGTRFSLVTPRGGITVSFPLAGRHNLYNALAAAAIADYYEVPLELIAEALAGVSRMKMRGEVVRFEEGFTIVDDSYNSNPSALIEMAATISASREGHRKIIVAGEMLELGQEGPDLHREAGRRIASLGIDMLIGVRGLALEMIEGAREAGMNGESAIFCETPEKAADILATEVRFSDLILVKGSRGVRTEIVVERIKREFKLRDEEANVMTG